MIVQVAKPRILFFDIETSNLRANIGRVLCCGIAFDDEKTKVLSLTDHMEQFKKDPTNDRYLLQDIYKEFLKADIVSGWYSRRFDLKFLNTRCLAHNMAPLPVVSHLDLWESCRGAFALTSNRLQTFQEFTHLNDSKTRLDFEVWTRAQAGHIPSLRYVEKHCYQDIEVLRQAYKKMLPFIKQHPTMKTTLNDKEHTACENCGSKNVHRRGRYITIERHYYRYQCQKCGHWFKNGFVK
jgi:uncharacterized protein YprB with RNaseH-like and TPR domain/predicted RNA-binding Zn-ribbon protein involved in translation (DUF1610 family)